MCLLSQCGEYLAVSDPICISSRSSRKAGSPNEDGSVWTFQIRRGVEFHDGRALTAHDVAATMNRLADPANGSIALSAFAGTLSKGGARALDAGTVEFRLDAPNGSFPYLVSSDNYNAIILPADYAGGFERDFNGTGPFRLERYSQGARLLRAQRAATGAPRRCRIASCSASTTASRRRCSRCRAGSSTCCCTCRCRAARRCSPIRA